MIPYVSIIRRSGYHCASFWRKYLVGAPEMFLLSAVRLTSQPQPVNGIRVGDPRPETREVFLCLMDHAFTLIAKSDPLRWKRVQREIRMVINTPSIWTSCYGRTARACMLDLRHFYLPDRPRLVVPLLGSILIYHATFGCLCSRGIFRTRKNSQRVDELRSREVMLFLRRCLPSTDMPAASAYFEEPVQGPGSKELVEALGACLTDEAGCEAALWKDLLRQIPGSKAS